MRRVLAESLVVIIEAVIELLAERIKERRRRNGNSD
jgi:ribose 1,5-bisphosphokinase PhnN